MQKLLIPALLLSLSLPSMAQVKEGKVVYERKINMHKRMPPEAEQFKAMVPEFQINKVELSFNSTQSLFKNIQEEENQMPTAGDAGMRRGGMFRMGGGSPNDQTFRDYDKELITESRELGPKTYLIDDTLRPLKWKMETDTMTINGYLCYKASTVTSAFGMSAGMAAGMRGPRNAADSARADSIRTANGGNAAVAQQRRNTMSQPQKVEAWFTQDIETSAGPDNYFGLPGLIMKVSVDEGTIEYKVLSLDTQSKTVVKAPTNGKKITREEYLKMMQQQFQGRPGGGGGRTQGTVIISQ